MNKKLIVIDAGHGGADPGAVARVVNGSSVTLVEEEDLNLDIALASQRALSAAGFNVALTRSADVHPSNAARAHLANDLNADAYIALHCNASVNQSAHGWEVLYGNNCPAGHALAESLAKSLECELPISARPREVIDELEVGRGDGFHLRVLHDTRCGAALIEAGFVTNPADRAYLVTPAGQARIAAAIVAGLDDYFQGGKQ